MTDRTLLLRNWPLLSFLLITSALLTGAVLLPLESARGSAPSREGHHRHGTTASAVSPDQGIEVLIRKTVAFPWPLRIGDPISYTVTLTNASDDPEFDPLPARLRDPIPGFTTYIVDSVTGGASYNVDTNQVEWFGMLGRGQSVTIGFAVTVDGEWPEGSQIVNTAHGTLATLEVSVTISVPGIVGFKFEDINGNGTWEFTDSNGNGRWDPGESGEPGVEGWGIALTGPGLEEPSSQQTDARGAFLFPLGSSGTYTVSEESREGWLPTTPGTVEVSVELIPGETLAQVLFGNRRQPTPTSTSTQTATQTATGTSTPTATQTATQTATATGTSTGTATATSTPTSTPTDTAVPACTEWIINLTPAS